MLGKEYFPNNNLTMKADLQDALVHYYDFLVAYENLLRDGGEFNTLDVTSVDTKYSVVGWGPQQGKLVTLNKKVGGMQVVHLFNFLKADSVSWRDLDGTMPEPDQLDDVVIDVPVTGEVKRVWMATPDFEGGAVQELSFKNANGRIRLKIPFLKYWDMIVIEY